MGRIRTKFIKRISAKLIGTKGNQFSLDFNENKNKVQELTDVKTKKLRNMIAGYITQKVKTVEK